VTRDEYVEGLIEAGSRLALPDLATGSWPDAIHRIRDRQGVGVLALPSHALPEDLNDALQRFRFAQYLAVGFIDPEVVYRERLEREPAGAPEPRTVNIVAFSPADGRLLANLALRQPAEAPPGTTLRDRERPLLPLEEHFGWGALNRLRILPDLPLDRIRELGRFVKNQRLGALAELGVRATVEISLAALRAFTGPLRLDVEAFVGEFEDSVARRNLEFLDAPFAVLRGGLPAFDAGHFLSPALDRRARYPFAGLVSDLTAAAGRAAAIEAALAAPGIRALAELAAEARREPRPRSSLLGPDGIPELADTALPQRRLSLAKRRRARARGDRLRSFAPFASLSDTESVTLQDILVEVRARRGDAVLTRGESSDAIYFIAAGEAEVQPGGPQPAVTLGPGDCFGEIGLLTGGERTADVVARSALKLLCLSEDAYRRYLRGIGEIDHVLLRMALTRAAAQLEAT
jgi:hypothetical protein